MGQELISQKIKRVCDGCGLVKEWELIHASNEQMIEMTEWYVVIHELFDAYEGQFKKLNVSCCSLPCVPAAAIKIAVLPVREEQADTDIDLEALRASTMAN